MCVCVCFVEADESFMDTISHIRQAIGGPESEISMCVCVCVVMVIHFLILP